MRPGPTESHDARCENSSRSMSQVKVFGLRSTLGPVIREVSDVIHSCVVDALQYPPDKRAHRFFQLEPEELFYPPGRTERFHERLGILPEDVEITIFETPKHNWGFRGLPGDEHSLNYKVDV